MLKAFSYYIIASFFLGSVLFLTKPVYAQGNDRLAQRLDRLDDAFEEARDRKERAIENREERQQKNQERLDERQDRLNEAIQEKEDRKAQAKQNRCEKITDRIGRRVDRMHDRAQRADARGDSHESRFQRLNDLGCDTGEIEALIATLQEKIAAFRQAREEMIAHLRTRQDAVCTTDESSDHDQQEAFKAEHQRLVAAMRSLAEEIKDFRQHTLKPVLEQFKTSCKETVRNQATEAE